MFCGVIVRIGRRPLQAMLTVVFRLLNMRLRVAKRLLCGLLVAAALLLTTAVLRMQLTPSPHSLPADPTALIDFIPATKRPGGKLRTPQEDFRVPPDPLVGKIFNIRIPPDPPVGRIPNIRLPPEFVNDNEEGESWVNHDVNMSRSANDEADTLWNLIQVNTKVPHPNEQGSLLDKSCQPKHHVFFAKVHKTGSSTVANILQRYGFARTLNFVLPRKRIHSRSYNYISMPGIDRPMGVERLIPHPLGEHYDILWNHAIYDRAFFHQIMPQDTIYVSILRQPLRQFQSAFEYYGHVPGSFLFNILQANVSNPLSLYLHNHSAYEAAGSYTSYIRNKQAQDLGMTNQHVTDTALRHEYIRQLNDDFRLVMITEFFDESLVLLRRLLCWTTKDILYIPKNKNNFKQDREFSDKDVAVHRELNVADYELYDFFLRKFNQTVVEQGPDFEREVRYFKAVVKRVQMYCSLEGGGRGGEGGVTLSLSVARSQWTEAFEVTMEDCRLMQKHELFFLDDLMVDAIGRYQQSVSRHQKS